jgi:hypothetical protein
LYNVWSDKRDISLLKRKTFLLAHDENEQQRLAKTITTSIAIIAIVAALALLGVVVMVTIVTIPQQQQEGAEARALGCTSTIPFNASKGFKKGGWHGERVWGATLFHALFHRSPSR